MALARRKQDRLPAEQLDAVQRGSFALGAPGSDGSFQQHAGEACLRVVTWNINRGRQYKKILRTLKRDLPADIYLFQEADAHARRTHYRNVAKDLARDLGMYYVFGIEFQELTQGKEGQPAFHGQAILSRFPIRWARVLRFTHQPNDWSHDWLQPRQGGRMALAAEIDTPAGSLVVYNTHLESRSDKRGRAQQMQEILSDIASKDYREPLLIAGDLNTKKGFPSPIIESAQRRGFKNVLFNLMGKNAIKGRRPLDWILTKGFVPISATFPSRLQASDHRPVSAELEFKGEPGS